MNIEFKGINSASCDIILESVNVMYMKDSLKLLQEFIEIKKFYLLYGHHTISSSN